MLRTRGQQGFLAEDRAEVDLHFKIPSNQRLYKLSTNCCFHMPLKLCAQLALPLLLDSRDLCLRIWVMHSGICKYGGSRSLQSGITSYHCITGNLLEDMSRWVNHFTQGWGRSKRAEAQVTTPLRSCERRCPAICLSLLLQTFTKSH
jgi:hypothetical protein